MTTVLKFLFMDRKPINIHSDKGTEFVNATVQQCLKRQGVNFHIIHNTDLKSTIIERFNRTLKTNMLKYFSRNSTIT